MPTLTCNGLRINGLYLLKDIYFDILDNYIDCIKENS